MLAAGLLHARPPVTEAQQQLIREALVTRSADQQPLSRHLQLSVNADDRDLAVTRALSDADGRYRMRLTVTLQNRSDAELDGSEELLLGLGPGLGEYPLEGMGIAQSLYSFVEPFAHTQGELLRLRDSDGNAEWRSLPPVDWGGLQSRYFTLLLEPLDGGAGAGRVDGFRYRSAGEAAAGLPARYLPEAAFVLDTSALPPGGQRHWSFSVYAGPKDREALQGSEGVTSYQPLLFAGLWDWMRTLGFWLLGLLTALHGLIPSWGLAIILLAVLVRLLMYPVAKRALQSQVAFARVQSAIQPELRRIRREYSGGEQSEMILDLYRQHEVSPLAGLKPLLIVMIQIPVFIALFHVLGTAYELRDASFLWMDTLAEPDRLFSFGVELPILGAWFNLLPVLMAFTTLLTIKLSPAPAADARARRRQTAFQVLMALGFLLLFYPFPAGMVLYWTVANVLHLLQQVVVERWSGRAAVT